MAPRLNLFSLLLLMLFIGMAVLQQTQQKALDSLLIQDFSFNFTKEYRPKAYYSFGAGIRLRTKIKLIPGIPNKSGAVFLNQKYRSSGFTIEYLFKFNSEMENSDGFIMWYLHQIPSFNYNSGRIHGVNQDTDGLSIRVYKTENNKWKVFAHYDRGHGNNLENAIIRPDNSWMLLLDPTKVSVKIKVQKIGNKLSVFQVDGNSNPEKWRSCVIFHNDFLNYEGYIGFTSGNTNHILNDIDIMSVMVTDHDPKSPYFSYESGLLSKEEHKEYVYYPMGPPSTSNDILHTSHRVGKLENTMKLIEFNLEDKKETILFKMWETLHVFNLNLSNLINTLQKFENDKLGLIKQWISDNQFTLMTSNLMKSKESVGTINNILHSLNDTVTFLSSEVSDVKSELTRSELEASNSLILTINKVNQKLDNLEQKMQAIESNSQSLINKYNKEGNQLKTDMSNTLKNKTI